MVAVVHEEALVGRLRPLQAGRAPTHRADATLSEAARIAEVRALAVSAKPSVAAWSSHRKSPGGSHGPPMHRVGRITNESYGTTLAALHRSDQESTVDGGRVIIRVFCGEYRDRAKFVAKNGKAASDKPTLSPHATFVHSQALQSSSALQPGPKRYSCFCRREYSPAA